MSAPTTPPHLLRRDARVMLESAAFMADLARLQLERIAESTDAPDAPDIEAADALECAIGAIDSAKRLLME
jgi:hypothetical protein